MKLKKIQIQIPKSKRVSPALVKKVINQTLLSLPKAKTNILKKYSEVEMNVMYRSPVQIQKINKTYRNKNKATDVLSFSGIESKIIPPPPYLFLGEIILCLAVAKKQALEQGYSFQDELVHLIIHGCLHIFKYDHEKNKADAKKMFGLQNKISKKLGFSTREWLRLGPS